jgi:CTP synthase
LRKLAMMNGNDVVLCEIGGTVGDFENGYLIEAIREMMYEEGEHNILFINLSYIVEPPHLGELKSKPAQLGLERLRMLGIQPDMIVCRSTNPVSQKIKEKMSVYSSVPVEDVIGLHNFDSVYRVPLMLHELKADERVFERLELGKRVDRRKLEAELKKWKQFTEKNVKADKVLNIGMAGKYTGLMDSYASIIKALEHAATHNNAKVNISFIETTDIESGKLSVEHALKGLDGLIVPGGFGSRGVEGKIACVKHCRENNIPFLGLCYGFQMAVIDFARHVCGLEEANSTEIDSDTKDPVICILPEQEEIEELGGTMRLGGFDLKVEKGSKAFEVYGKKETIRERFRHRFNVNTQYIETLEKNGLVFSGRAPEKRIMQILELPEHKFFMASQFHPEFNSRPLRPAPLFYAFIKAILS